MISTEDRAQIDPDLEKIIKSIRLVAFDFDGVFTDNTVYVSEDGCETVRCFRGDGIGLQKLRNLGIEMVVISTESNPVVAARCRKLGIRCISNCPEKLTALESLIQELGLSAPQVAFVGNDINDLSSLVYVGLPIVVQDAHPEVISSGRFRTTARGGFGAVREICDMFARVLAREDE